MTRETNGMSKQQMAVELVSRWGWGGTPINYKEPEPPLCPVCGEECETVYRAGRHGDIVGCDDCIIECDAWDAPECGCPEEDG